MLQRLRRALRRKKEPSEERPGSSFRERYEGFKELLESNSELLSLIAEIEGMLAGDEVFGMSWVRSRASRTAFHGARVVHGLNRLSRGAYPGLAAVMDGLGAKLNDLVEARRGESCPHLVLPLAEVGREMADWVGGKNAHLGEMTGPAGMPVPPGFAVTTAAYELFVESAGLRRVVRRAKMDLDPADPDSARRVSEDIQRAFLTAPLPDELERAIHEACEALRARLGPDRPDAAAVALRSSAIGEDGELSFAGQYLTVLGVEPGDVPANYKRVLASLFTPRAIAYRLHKGVGEGDLAMAVGCLAMVDARAAGVAYSKSPVDPASDAVLINAVWGLGTYAVDGVVVPDEYLVSRGAGHELLAARAGYKPVRQQAGPRGRLLDVPVPEAEARTLCLDEARARRLAGLVLDLERHFGGPQDVEWAQDREGRLFILQARPLRAVGGQAAAPPPPGAEVLLSGGDAACPGLGSGPVHHLLRPEDAADFPQGAVLAVRHSSPKFVAALPRAAAVVAETGSVTGHMASLVREFGVPAVFNLPGALGALAPGEVVTVDGAGGRVFRGRLPGAGGPRERAAGGMRGTAVYEALARLGDLATPLNLTDPAAPEFRPSACRTVHDVMRYAHERSYEELFRWGDEVSGGEGAARRIDAPLPLDLYVIDLGGALTGVAPGDRSAGLEQVASVPLRALLAGMTHEGLTGREPRPVDLRGFLSVMASQMTAPPPGGPERFGRRSYALASDVYLNFSSRVGYHYGVLDCWCGERVDENHLSFGFKGGAADDVRRERRCRAIALILEGLGFTVRVAGDRVDARYRKYGREAVRERLDQLGRLLIFTRQMDMLMADEASVNRAAERFLAGRYDP